MNTTSVFSFVCWSYCHPLLWSVWSPTDTVPSSLWMYSIQHEHQWPGTKICLHVIQQLSFDQRPKVICMVVIFFGKACLIPLRQQKLLAHVSKCFIPDLSSFLLNQFYGGITCTHKFACVGLLIIYIFYCGLPILQIGWVLPGIAILTASIVCQYCFRY